MRLRTVLKVVVVLLVAVIVAAVAFVLAIDPNDYKDDITARVEEETGRKLTIGGPIGLDIGGTTKLVLQDVAFANAEWGSRPNMATVGRLEAELALWPLIGGDIRLERVLLRDTDVLIETDAQGRSNLDFAGLDEEGEAADGDDDAGLDIAVGEARIENVSVTMIDGQAGTTTVARLERAIAAPPQPDAPLDVDVKGDVTRGESVAKVDLSGQVGSFESMLSGSEPVPVNLHGSVLGYTVAVEGGVRQPEHPDGVDVRIAISGNGFSTIQPFIATPLPDLGPVKLSAHVSGPAEKPVIENISVEAAKTRITGRANLDLSEDDVAAGYALKVALNGQDLALVSPYAGMPLEELGPLNGSMNVVGNLDRVRLEPNAITADKSRLGGSVEADITKEPPAVKYDLTLTADGQTLAIAEPFVGTKMPDLGPIHGSVRAVGDRRKARIEITDLSADKSTLSGQVTADKLESAAPQVAYDVTLRADGQSLEIVRPYVGTEMPALGPIRGSVRAVGDRQKARVEITDVSADKSTLSGQVKVDELESAAPQVAYDITLRADAQSLEIVRPYVGDEVSNLGVVNGGLHAVGNMNKAKVDLNDITIDKSRIAGHVNVDRSGAEPKADYDVTLIAEQQTLALLRPFVGPSLPDMGPLDLTVKLKGDAQKAQFEQLSLKGEEIDLTGSGMVDLSGERPRVEAKLASELLNIVRYMPDEEPPRKPRLTSKEEAASVREPSGRVFPTDPLPVDTLTVANADVSLKAKKLITPKGEFSDVDMRLLLEDGALHVRPLNLTYAQSAVSGDVSVDARGGTPLLAASLRGPDIAIGELLKDLADLDVIRGSGTVNIALNGGGKSVAEIMGSLNGHARLLMGEGQMRNEGLGYVSGVFSGIGEVLGKKEWVAVDCMAIDYQIEKGVATSRVSLLNTEVIRLAADGQIDLGKERYNLRITPSPSGLDLSLAVPVDVRGPLGSPSFSPNPVGTLTKLGSLFGTIVFPPAAIVGLAELGGGDNPCLDFAKSKAGGSGATPSSPLEQGSGGGGLMDVPGKALKGLFGD